MSRRNQLGVNLSFGPQNPDEAKLFAVEKFRVRVQLALHTLMKRKNISQRALSVRMGVTEARISQIFSSECNVTLRTLAELLYALEQECDVYCEESRLVFSTGPRRGWNVHQLVHTEVPRAKEVASVHATTSWNREVTHDGRRWKTAS